MPTRSAAIRARSAASCDVTGAAKRYAGSLAHGQAERLAGDRAVEKQLKAQVYFADPHSPWQRGCNENFNGLLRQFFPRKRDFSTITAPELQQAEDQLNNRPRKRLGYLTPAGVFFRIRRVIS